MEEELIWKTSEGWIRGRRSKRDLKQDQFKGRILKCQKCEGWKKKMDESWKGSKKDVDMTRIDSSEREYWEEIK